MKWKRILSFVLTLVLIVTLMPLTTQAAKGDKLIALTFDDGPSKTYTKQLLDGLKTRGAKVTFFMVGNNAASNINLVQRAYDEGHEVANHTYSHPNLNTLGWSGVQSQLNKTSAVLDKVCGLGTDYIVRPPYGNANSTVLSAMSAPAILWSVDTNDWKYRNTSYVYNHIINNAYDGAIVLCHDIHSTTIPAALQAVDTLQARGYEFVTVSELYRRRGATLKDGTKYTACKNNGIDLGPVKAPVITYEPADGGARITITSPSGAPVYYTTNGSRFNQESTRYTGSFVTQCPVEIQAVAAFNLNGGRSEKVTFKLGLLPSAVPEMTVEDGLAIFSSSTSFAPIYYTFNGTKATTSAIKYTGAVTIEPDTMIRAVAGGGSYMVSEELMMYYSENENLFSDVFPSQWFFGAIDELVTLGLMNGVGGNTYEPNADTTRAMMVTMLYRYSGEKLEEGWNRTNSFTDVADGTWYSEAVEWAYRNGVIDGYPDNTFRHKQSILRQEMAQMFVRFLNYRGYSLSTENDCREKFGDGALIADWALDSVNAVVDAGLMQGDNNGNLNPTKSATRAETGTVLLRMMDLEEQMEQKREEEEATEDTETTPPAEEEESTEDNETTPPVEEESNEDTETFPEIDDNTEKLRAESEI